MFQTEQKELRTIFWRVKYSVLPNEVGFLYRKNRLLEKLEPGIYKYFDFSKELNLLSLSLATRIQTILNQEVLTKDNVALRFSYFVEYRIGDADKFIEKIDVFSMPYNIFYNAEQVIHNLSQVYFRRIISEIESEDLNEKRNDILPEIPSELRAELGEYGIDIVRILIKDLTFPKQIQDLFAKQLESKIRAKADLENARTQVAVSRALKNASELMKGDDNIKFMQFMETITKIADKGKHTFVIGDVRSIDGTK
jgi:regulator of protease activity HflC (stomatin/prohibitin superfamily)